MTLRTVWSSVRRVVPLQAYPALVPFYRWDRRRRLRKLEQSDRQYFRDRAHAVVPPAALRMNVVGPCTIPDFLRGGVQTAEDIERALARADTDVAATGRLLDFGCGCGRLLLAARERWAGVELFGCDVDSRAVDWCAGHLDDADVRCTDPLPPLPYDDGYFDVVWCGSVFTHLDEQRQDEWLAELRRILRPGGVLLASVHGPHCWSSRLPAWTIEKLQTKGFLFAKTNSDKGIHPDWYQVAWHTEEYVRRHWQGSFEIRNYLPRGFNENQDIVVARRR